MNEQDEKLLQLYLRDIRKKKIICISIIIFFVICILFYRFYIKNKDYSNETENSFQENIENNISNMDIGNEVENTVIREDTEDEVEETKENTNIIATEEKTKEEIKEKPKENTQTNIKNENDKNTNEKPVNKDFLFTDGYTMENVTQIAQDYLKSSGYAGECIPIKDEDGVYLGMRVTFY